MAWSRRGDPRGSGPALGNMEHLSVYGHFHSKGVLFPLWSRSTRRAHGAMSAMWEDRTNNSSGHC